TELLDLRPRHVDGFRCEPLEKLVIVDRRLHGGPDWKCRYKGLREGYQLRALARRFGNQAACLPYRLLCIQKHRRDMRGAGFELWIFDHGFLTMKRRWRSPQD